MPWLLATMRGVRRCHCQRCHGPDHHHGLPPPLLLIRPRTLFAALVQYNMKLVIRGDQRTGKTALFLRLQGKVFLDTYKPTPQTQTATINWTNPAGDDTVQISVWDVIDYPARPKAGKSTKAAPSDPASGTAGARAYDDAHAVIFCIDPTKPWTFDYVQREMEHVPAHMPILGTLPLQDSTIAPAMVPMMARVRRRRRRNRGRRAKFCSASVTSAPNGR